MSGWQYTTHRLEATDKGFTCAVCGYSWSYTPTKPCPGIKMYQWGQWPKSLLTKKQLNAAGYSTSATQLPQPAGAVWREESPDGLMFLYNPAEATIKRPMGESHRAALTERLVEGWKCRRCGDKVERQRFGSGLCGRCAAHNEARDWAREMLVLCHEGEAVILDSETTGLNASYNEIIELGLLDGRGEVLLDRRIKPLYPERMLEGSPCASDIHGIWPDDLLTAPSFKEVYPKVCELVKDKVVLIYNRDYDYGMLNGDCKRHSLPCLEAKRWLDVMIPYARWRGERRYDGSYRWQKLNGGHSAVSDCKAVLKLLHEMAELP